MYLSSDNETFNTFVQLSKDGINLTQHTTYGTSAISQIKSKHLKNILTDSSIKINDSTKISIKSVSLYSLFTNFLQSVAT